MSNWSYTFSWLSATTAAATWTTFSNVQTGSVSYQRDNVTDCLPRLSGRLQGRRPDLMPAIQIGDGVKIAADGFTYEFIVADYKVNYGIVSNEDTWVLSLEDVTARLGRYYGDFTWADGARAGTTYGAVVDRVANYDYPTTDSTIGLSAQTLTAANGAATARAILDSMQATQQLGYWSTSIVFAPSFFVPAAKYWQTLTTGPTFSDGTVIAIGSGHWKFDSVDFASLANQYWDKATARPAGLAAQTAGTGTRAYTFQTYNQTTATASTAASATLSRTNVNSRVPISISCAVTTQTSTVTGASLSQIVTVYLRGATYYAYVLGVDYTFDPAQTRMTVTLTDYQSVNYLKLDDAILGRLDYNELGF